MQTKVLTLRFNTLRGEFDDATLREFTRDKEVISVRDHFYVHQGTPYLAMVVNYKLGPLPAPAADQPSATKGTRRRDESWRHSVSEADAPLFNALRDWRAERCKREGVPPYIVGTNQQFTEIIKLRPQTLAKLGEIEGFGKSRIEKYGAEILAILAPPKELPKGEEIKEDENEKI